MLTDPPVSTAPPSHMAEADPVCASSWCPLPHSLSRSLFKLQCVTHWRGCGASRGMPSASGALLIRLASLLLTLPQAAAISTAELSAIYDAVVAHNLGDEPGLPTGKVPEVLASVGGRIAALPVEPFLALAASTGASVIHPEAFIEVPACARGQLCGACVERTGCESVLPLSLSASLPPPPLPADRVRSPHCHNRECREDCRGAGGWEGRGCGGEYDWCCPRRFTC